MISFSNLGVRKKMLRSGARLQLWLYKTKSGCESGSSVTFSKCVAVQVFHSSYLTIHAQLTGNSMWTRLNKHSPWPPHQCSNMLFPHLRSCMHLGRKQLPRNTISISSQLLLLGWASSTVTTNEVPSWMLISWPWVTYFCFI